MNNVEKRLAEEKKRMNSITAPEELEMRLRNALNTAAPRRKRKTPIWMMAAAALFLMFFVGYHYNAVAFYGKKLFGFDEMMDRHTLKKLDDEGMGQIIEKKIKLKDGSVFVINGLIADANQLVMYYTLTNPNGIKDYDNNLFPLTFSKITGFSTNSDAVSGSILANDDHTEIKGTKSFEPVSPFAKKLTLHFGQYLQNGEMTEESISFPYAPNKAMQTTIKQSVKKTVKVDKGKITFHSIKATPTMTVIDGELNVKNFDRVPGALDRIELIANGTPIDSLGGSVKSSIWGTKFEIHYDALPKQLDSLELVVKEFVGYQKLGKKLPLASIDDKPIMLDHKQLWVKNVSTTSENVEITIATEDDVMLDGVSIKTQNKETPLKTIRGQIHTNQEDGREVKERTLLFETKTKPEFLLIEGMHYMKTYNHVIDIPIK
ncbi:DUF4179 domain-containing protein [Bacillus chungangensis]|uniref:DUF4179 domain-containing protein n=1 Tax=Bacillus chungangensis TaxID=587633 RepID=A0ABT9WZ39_9BACI|nr:DUF4179 domain-containing protein [Bacillus chungangensis]MDQ0178499.1 hypothetical protein [Bacillus chungangensis]